MMANNFELNFTLNSGLDIWAHQTRNQSLLANLRALRFRLSETNQKNFYQKELLTKSEKQTLRKAKHHGLVTEFDSGFQFRSEQSCLMRLVRSRELSISMRELIYSSASNYTLSPDLNRKSRKPIDFKKKKTFQDLSFAVSILSFRNHTGQQKIANRLGLSRQTICQKTKQNPFLHSQQCWVRVEKLYGKPDLTVQKAQTFLKGFGGYRIGQDGWLYRQVTNQYRNRNIIIIFSDHKTFRFQNRKLNGSLFAEASCASATPIVKRISWLRSKSRTKRCAEGLRDKKHSILNSDRITQKIFEQHSYRTEIQHPRTKRTFTVEQQYTLIRIPYGKLGRELHMLMLKGLIQKAPEGNLRVYRGSLKSIESRQYRSYLKGMKEPAGSKKKNISRKFLRERNMFNASEEARG